MHAANKSYRLNTLHNDGTIMIISIETSYLDPFFSGVRKRMRNSKKLIFNINNISALNILKEKQRRTIGLSTYFLSNLAARRLLVMYVHVADGLAAMFTLVFSEIVHYDGK